MMNDEANAILMGVLLPSPPQTDPEIEMLKKRLKELQFDDELQLRQRWLDQYSPSYNNNNGNNNGNAATTPSASKTLRRKTGRKTGNHTKRKGLTPEARKALSKIKDTHKKFIASRELNRKYLMLRQFIISNKIRNIELNGKMRTIYLNMIVHLLIIKQL